MKKIICVDLDGTLIKEDVSLESVKKFAQKNFQNFFKLCFWICCGGIPFVKYKVAENIELDPSSLQYNSELISYLKNEKRDGAKIFLATGSTEKYAKQIAEYLQIFDGVFASDREINLVGRKKAEKLSQNFEEFSYAGNSKDDLLVWAKADECIVVNHDNILENLKKAKKIIIF